MKNEIKIEQVSESHKIVRGYVKGFCYAVLFSADTLNRDIVNAIRQRLAVWRPYNEATGTFTLNGRGRMSGVKPLTQVES